MTSWFWYAVAAAVLYGAHQIFTKLAADRIGEGLGGFVVEASAAVSILLYLAFLWLSGTLIKNSARLDSIIPFSLESVLEQARSRSFFCSSAVVRYRLFRLF